MAVPLISATSGFFVTNGPAVEQWGGGSSGFGLFFFKTTGADILVTNNPATVFTSGNLAAILPGGFPGASGGINITAYIPQNTGSGTSGNSAVLKFEQDIPRPASGIKTIYVSYLLDVTGNFNAATGGNAGRYAGFLSQTNIFEGTGSGGAYATWTPMFNTFGTSPNYVAYGEKTNSPSVAGQGDNICPADSSIGAGGTGASGVKAIYNTANFVVGCFTFTAGGATKDTNTVWINPPLADFGGLTPSANNLSAFTMGTVMSDVDAFFLESRSGGATGGIGPTFIGNLLIGTTWSYVTGGPEFTNSPQNVSILSYGTNVTLSGSAVAAAQSVIYQWQKVVGGSTNNLTNGIGMAGGTAVVSGSQSQNFDAQQRIRRRYGTISVARYCRRHWFLSGGTGQHSLPGGSGHHLKPDKRNDELWRGGNLLGHRHNSASLAVLSMVFWFNPAHKWASNGWQHALGALRARWPATH